MAKIKYGENKNWEMQMVIFSTKKWDVACKDIRDSVKRSVKKMPFKEGEVYLCLGEIKNMPGHYAYVGKSTRDKYNRKSGNIHWGYHSDFFELYKD